MPTAIVREVVGTTLAETIRARLMRAGYTRFALLDRGSYEHCDGVDEPDLLRALAELASEITGRRLVLDHARALRLRAGDYLLLHHDRVHHDRPVELVLDLSPAPVLAAEVHYRHRGQVYFTFGCDPGAMALVERGPTVMCNHTYVSKLHERAEVVRLVLLFRGASSPSIHFGATL